MGVRANAMALIMLMMASMLTFPVASAEDSGRDASIVLTVSPTTLEVNPGESGEYTVTVRNLGSDPVSVQLSAANAQDCQGYTTTITQIPGQIEAGSSEEASMNVTLAQNAEGECDTTVTAVANEQTTPPDPPGQPAQEEATVTTTAGDGSGNALYGVEVEIDAPSLTYNGESVTEWTGTVTSTGQAQGTNVQLSIERRNGPDCDNDGGMNPEVTPSTMENMAPDSEEDFTITTQVTDGMRATKDCWTLVAEVTNPSQEPASDSAEFDLTVPEVKDCAASVGSTLRLDPGEMGTTNVMIGNEGNTEFTAYIAFSGDARDWVEVDGTRSGLVEYDGTRTFQLEVTPPSPATVAAGEEVTADVVVRDTSSGRADSLRIGAPCDRRGGAQRLRSTDTQPPLPDRTRDDDHHHTESQQHREWSGDLPNLLRYGALGVGGESRSDDNDSERAILLVGHGPSGRLGRSHGSIGSPCDGYRADSAHHQQFDRCSHLRYLDPRCDGPRTVRDGSIDRRRTAARTRGR